MYNVDRSQQPLSKTSLKPSHYREAEEPNNKPSSVENNSTDSQTLSEKSHNTRRWEHKNSKCSPPAPVAQRTGTADEEQGTRSEQCGGPSAPKHRQPALAVHLVSITHHPLLPGSLHCHHNASQLGPLPLPQEQFYLDKAKHNTLPGEIWPQFAC